MRDHTIILAVLFALVATGCSHSSKNDQQNDPTIALNNGQKWTVNAEMKPYVTEAEQLLQQYNGSGYKALADQLDEKNQGLIKSCTMNGKSHEELHKWLHLHIQLTKDLGNVENQKEANKIITELKGSFQIYHKHFQ